MKVATLSSGAQLPYDICLDYWYSRCEAKIGEEVYSGITDDNEVTHVFAGRAVVVAIAFESDGRRQLTKLFVRMCSPPLISW